MKTIIHCVDAGAEFTVIQHSNGSVEISMMRSTPKAEAIVMTFQPGDAAEIGTTISTSTFPFEKTARSRPLFMQRIESQRVGVIERVVTERIYSDDDPGDACPCDYCQKRRT